MRIARNLGGYPIPPEASDNERAAVATRVCRAAERQAWFPIVTRLDMDELHPLDRRLLEEKRMISPEFARPHSHRVALVARNQAFSMLVNEEDHLRIQAIRPGLEVFAAWQQASALEHSLGIVLDFAYSDRVGYTTACSSNRGSGLRASVMLFLPALIDTQRIAPMLWRIHAAGYTVRGLYGEGTPSFGSLIQISHHIRAIREDGQRAEIQRLYAVCRQIVTEERRARRQFLTSSGRNRMRKQVERIQQAINTADTITFQTGMAMLSKLRLAAALQAESHAFNNHDQFNARLVSLNRLMMRIQPAHIRQYAGSSGQQRLSEDRVRAGMLKQTLLVQV